MSNTFPLSILVGKHSHSKVTLSHELIKITFIYLDAINVLQTRLQFNAGVLQCIKFFEKGYSLCWRVDVWSGFVGGGQ